LAMTYHPIARRRGAGEKQTAPGEVRQRQWRQT
jgi:hypothetical protein